MGKLVQNRDDAALSDRIRDLGPEHITFGEGHSAGVLHCSSIELRNEQLVVFLEWVGDTEFRLKVFEPFASDVDDVVGIEILRQRFPGENTQRNCLSAGAD